MTPGQPFPIQYPSVRILYGPGTLAEVPQEVARLGARRALVLCGKTIGQGTPVLDLLRTGLGDRYAGAFTGVVARTSRESITAAIAQTREVGADLLISVGGGSAVGTARTVALQLAGGAVEAAKLPIITVPTTLSASEANAGYLSVDGQTVTDAGLRPAVAVLDPELLAYTPDELFLSTGLNAMNHCVEGLCSVLHQPFADAHFLHSLRLLADNLPRSAGGAGRLDARGQALLGAYMSGLMYEYTWLGISHALCHGLGRIARTPHGLNNSVMITHGMRYNLEVAPDRLALVGMALGVSTGSDEGKQAEEAIGAMEALRRRLGLPSRLRDIGVARDVLPQVAQLALHDFFTPYNPRQPQGAEELLAVLEGAW